MSAGTDGFLSHVAEALLAPTAAVVAHEGEVITRVGVRFADVLARGGTVYAFGAGHSKAVADELCHRAGGLRGFVSMNLQDLRIEPRSAHFQFSDSEPERIPANGPALLDLFGVGPDDALLIASQSGRNGAIVEMARVGRARGTYVAAVVSTIHSRATVSRHPEGLRLLDLADDVVDNHGTVGDAAFALTPNEMLGSTSTITGALIAQLISVSTAQALRSRGAAVPVIVSANVDHPASPC